MANAARAPRILVLGWTTAAVLGISAAVYVGREISGLAQAPERLLGLLSIVALVVLLLHLRRSRSLQLAEAQAAGRLCELVQELQHAHQDWLVSLSDKSSTDWLQPGQQDRVLKAIDEIVLLTNMTAVNAALEATRAPESLQGFTVVADEVRDLARRSTDASRELADLFGRHQSEAARSEAAAGRLAETIDQVKALLVDQCQSSGTPI